MKIEIDRGCITLYFDKKQTKFIHTLNDWNQLKGGFNWYTFTFINLSFENDYMCPGLEMEFQLLGLGFRVRLNRSWEGTDIQKRIDDVESGEAKLVPFEDIFKDKEDINNKTNNMPKKKPKKKKVSSGY